jgi:four helix bundle protein
MSENTLKEKSYAFALRIVNLYKYLANEQKEYVLSKQVLRSGTAIGALVREAEFGQSKQDFIHKLSIALKEANETDYWLSLLRDSNYITSKMYDSLAPDIDELLRLLIASVKTAKSNK